jgi:hypothetical protein
MLGSFHSVFLIASLVDCFLITVLSWVRMWTLSIPLESLASLKCLTVEFSAEMGRTEITLTSRSPWSGFKSS